MFSFVFRHSPRGRRLSVPPGARLRHVRGAARMPKAGAPTQDSVAGETKPNEFGVPKRKVETDVELHNRPAEKPCFDESPKTPQTTAASDSSVKAGAEKTPDPTKLRKFVAVFLAHFYTLHYQK